MTQSAADLLPTPSARWQAQLQAGARRVAATESWHVSRRVTRATALVLEATGLRLAVGAACKIQIAPGENHWADAEVVGVYGHTLYLMPQIDITAMQPGDTVIRLEHSNHTQVPRTSSVGTQKV